MAVKPTPFRSAPSDSSTDIDYRYYAYLPEYTSDDNADPMSLIVERCQQTIQDIEERFLVQLDKHKILSRETSSQNPEARQKLSILLIEVIQHGLRTL